MRIRNGSAVVGTLIEKTLSWMRSLRAARVRSKSAVTVDTPSGTSPNNRRPGAVA
jgi:hypothetical protein